MSCELGTELYFVLAGWFSQIKNSRLPSADTVGRNSGRSELMFVPKFSILIIVLLVMMLSYWAINLPVSLAWLICAVACCRPKARAKKGITLLTRYGFNYLITYNLAGDCISRGKLVNGQW